MDQFTRRIIGFGAHAGDVDGVALCCMFNKAISKQSLPKRLSTDNDPLFQCHQWKANLRVLDIEEIKSVPHVPLSHPFAERLIETIRREHLDQTLFCNAGDLEKKLCEFRDYYNHHRVHASLKRHTPTETSRELLIHPADLRKYDWMTFCHGLYQLPMTT